MIKNVVDEANSLSTPFGMTTQVVMSKVAVGKGPIKRETGWLLVCVKSSTKPDQLAAAQMDAAFRGQTIVMKLAQNRIVSVWLAHSSYFDATKAERAVPGWKVPVVVAFGSAPAGWKWAEEKWETALDKRQPLSNLFWDRTTKAVVSDETAGSMLEPYRCLVSGPSGMNGQPWRFVVDGKWVHLYDGVQRGYSAFDIGICIANMRLVGLHLKKGTVKVETQTPVECPLGGKYICSVEFG